MKIIVIGAGNWGTTLACLLGKNNRVSLWTHRAEHAREINETRENSRYLKGVRLPESVSAAAMFQVPIEEDDIILMVVPSRELPRVAKELRPHLNGQPIVCASKGFQHTTFKTMGQVIAETVPESPLIILTGPNIAHEIAKGKPTKAVLASEDLQALTLVSRLFRNETVQFEISRDVRGVELCAALKGIIAIGVGIADGLELGDNFTGVLMTYGLREFAAIAEFLGISDKTIYGIAGMGDLIATCLSKDSRNRRFGCLLGKGASTDHALHEVGMVVEGVQMAKTIVDMGELNISIPLFSTIARAIFDGTTDLREEFVHCLIQYRG
jgi:glycerol-3-phosphate dehydrogenase (NAD(P)+)